MKMIKLSRTSLSYEWFIEFFAEVNIIEKLLVYIINYFWVEEEAELDKLSKLIKILVEYSSLSYVYEANPMVVKLTQLYPELFIDYINRLGQINKVNSNSNIYIKLIWDKSIWLYFMIKNSNWYTFDMTGICNYYNRDSNSYIFSKIIILWVKLIICSIFTIWARGVGPRFRSDQMSDWTWKDILVILVSFLVMIIYWTLLG